MTGIERGPGYLRNDPRLDWRPTHDPRSRMFGIREVTGDVVPEVARTWTVGPVLDQGSEGACVGFGWTGELLASPRPDPYATAEVGNGYALSVYREAQTLDDWPGESYSGTSVLAGAKAVMRRGHIGGYRWAFGVEDVRRAVISEGPVVIGIPWRENMYETRPSGLVDATGDIVGGHCILVYGYHPAMRISGEGWLTRWRVFRWRNSWGPGYGIGGSGLITYDDLGALLSHDGWGEACVPVDRRLVRL